MKEIYTSATKIALIVLLGGMVYMNIVGVDLSETYKTITLMVVSFYFGQKTNIPGK